MIDEKYISVSEMAKKYNTQTSLYVQKKAKGEYPKSVTLFENNRHYTIESHFIRMADLKAKIKKKSEENYYTLLEYFNDDEILFIKYLEIETGVRRQGWRDFINGTLFRDRKTTIFTYDISKRAKKFYFATNRMIRRFEENGI